MCLVVEMIDSLIITMRRILAKNFDRYATIPLVVLAIFCTNSLIPPLPNQQVCNFQVTVDLTEQKRCNNGDKKHGKAISEASRITIPLFFISNVVLKILSSEFSKTFLQ